MKNRFITQGLLYIVLGIVFVYFAIQQVNDHGFGFFAYVIIGMATVDFVTGLCFIFQALRHKKKNG